MLIVTKFRKHKRSLFILLAIVLIVQLVNFVSLDEEPLLPLDKDLRDLSDFLFDRNVTSKDRLVDIYRNLSISPINRISFHYSPGSPPLCVSGDFVLLIKSAVNRFENRNILRQFFSILKRKRKFSFRWFFFVGLETTTKVETHLNQEMRMNPDLVQADFVDNYLNNTLKVMSEIFWMRENICLNQRGQVFLFVDDDVFINFHNLHHLRSHMLEKPALIGHAHFKAAPFRWWPRKWVISRTMYSHNYYPPYISGSTVVMNKETLLKLSYTIPFVKMLPFDDVYLGIVASKLGIQVRNEEKVLTNPRCGWFCSVDFTKQIAIHIPDDEGLLLSLYNKLSSSLL